MLSAYAIAGVLGLLLGLRYKAAAMITLALTIVVAGTALLPFAGWSIPGSFAVAFVASAALQFGYLSGLAVTCVASRGRYWPRAMRRYVRNYATPLANPRAGTR
jgi:hypothetical protein